MSVTSHVHAPVVVDQKGRRAIWGAFAGFFIDMFDIYLPIAVLGPAMIYFLSPDISAGSKAIIDGMIFTSSLLGRPLGALIFGRFADKLGRKRVTITVVYGFGTVTLLMAIMPGYATWGMTAVVLFILLRFVGGIFMGGEYTGANPLAMEYSPKGKRGLYSGMIQSAYPLAFAATASFALLMLNVAPADGLDSPYMQWGWRIPFVIGGLMAYGLGIYYTKFVHESELFQASGGTRQPLRSLFSGDSLRSFLQIFLLMTGMWLALNPATAILPKLLKDPLGLASTTLTVILIFAYLILAVGFVGAGVLSQRIGRRTLFILAGFITIASAGLYYALLASNGSNFGLLVLLTIAVVVLIQWHWGALTAYINERFHTGVRASGFGLGYSVGTIIPAFYGFYQAGLGHFMSLNYTGIPMIVIGGVVVVLAAAWGPETKNVDFVAHDDTETEPTPAVGSMPLGQSL